MDNLTLTLPIFPTASHHLSRNLNPLANHYVSTNLPLPGETIDHSIAGARQQQRQRQQHDQTNLLYHRTVDDGHIGHL